jgi:hypothetical protein
MAEFTADNLASKYIQRSLKHIEDSTGGSTGGWRFPARQSLVSRLRIGMS